MKRDDGFDYLPEVMRRLNKPEEDDKWRDYAVQAMCLIVLCGAMIAASLWWLPHG